MDSTSPTKKSAKKSLILENEIDVMRDKLKKLEEQHRLQVQKERDKNWKLVVDLIKSEKLDLISVDQWRLALPEIIKALSAKSPGHTKNIGERSDSNA